MSENYPDKSDLELIKAISTLQSEKEVEAFLRDVFTLAELKEASKRFQIAKLLWLGGHSYLQIADRIKTSTTTVTRVADWLFKKGLNGYQIALSRMFPKKS